MLRCKFRKWNVRSAMPGSLASRDGLVDFTYAESGCMEAGEAVGRWWNRAESEESRY